ncbi:MAG: hypothetical protein ACRCS9_16325 [Hyphomicrobium sp.]
MTGTDQSYSFVRRAFRGCLLFLVFVFATLGLVLGGLELTSWNAGQRWSPEDINALIVAESPARTLAQSVWDNFKFLLQYGSVFAGAVAFAVALTQLKTIARLIRDFIEARGPIYSLGTTIAGTEKSVDALSKEVDRLSRLEPTIREMAEKIEETFAQIANLQRLTVSERTDTAAVEEIPQPMTDGHAVPTIAAQNPDIKNWERLRELWNNNGERLDSVIDRIPDKRKRGKFQRMPRTDYRAIINALADENYISEAVRNASVQLHSTFMSYKSRNRQIPDEAVGSVEVLDRMLEKEIPVPALA